MCLNFLRWSCQKTFWPQTRWPYLLRWWVKSTSDPSVWIVTTLLKIKRTLVTIRWPLVDHIITKCTNHEYLDEPIEHNRKCRLSLTPGGRGLIIGAGTMGPPWDHLVSFPAAKPNSPPYSGVRLIARLSWWNSACGRHRWRVAANEPMAGVTGRCCETVVTRDLLWGHSKVGVVSADVARFVTAR